MTLATVVVIAMFVGVTLYALLAGADFGGGFWDLLAGDAERGAGPRDLIEHSVGPVWEANHVWLIFVLVVLWTGFPRAFAPIMSTLAVPLTLAAVGIILRGSGFAFRKASITLPTRRVFGVTFAASSVLTPFFLGSVVGGVASGRVPATGTGSLVSSWANPTSMLGGVLAVVACAFLAAVYLTADAAAQGLDDLTAYFRSRAIASGVAAGIVAAVGVAVLHADASRLFAHLTGRALPLIVLSGVAGVVTLVLLKRGGYGVARITAALAVVAVIWGWAAGQYPYLISGRVTIAQAQGAHATLQALLATVIAGAVVIGPALAWLLLLARRGELGRSESGT
ncbi:MAG TPA: cytochrome d ubiquinol oxidase subunit II [Acidimicrobiia bacterium]